MGRKLVMTAKKNSKVTKPLTEMRRFQLHRSEDISGMSGIGTVAEGVELTCGKCIVTWMSNLSSITIYDNLKIVEEIHGHEGRTKVVFID